MKTKRCKGLSLETYTQKLQVRVQFHSLNIWGSRFSIYIFSSHSVLAALGAFALKREMRGLGLP
jgi:hypothetical protein